VLASEVQGDAVNCNTCYYDKIICVKQVRCIIIKIPNNCRELIVLCPGVTQLKMS